MKILLLFLAVAALAGNLDKLAPFLPAPGEWALVPGTAFGTWTDGCTGTVGDHSDGPCQNNGNLVRVSDAELSAWGIPRRNYGSNGVLITWNGAAYDRANHTFYLHGGGHNGYDGNEVYSLNLETVTLTREIDPAPLTAQAPDGAAFPAYGPHAAHSYDGNTWSPVTNSFFVFPTGGAGWYNKIAEFVPSQKKWFLHGDWGDPGGYSISGYDPVSKRIPLINGRGANKLRIYDPQTKQFVGAGSGNIGWVTNGVGHMWKGAFVFASDPSLYTIDVTTFRRTKITDLPSALSYQGGWDIRGDEFVFWDGKKEVWVYDTKAAKWTTHTPATGPSQSNFVFSKWAYLPEVDAFAGFNHQNEGLWLYRLPGATTVQSPVQTAPVNLKITAFPNPFSRATTLRLANQTGPAALKIYGPTGKQLFASVFSGEATWSAKKRPPGVYVARVIKGGRVFSKRLFVAP